MISVTNKIRNLFSSRVRCNVCGWKGHEFKTMVTPRYTRKNVACPKCGSMERHRGLVYDLEHRESGKGDFTAGARILDIAPMAGFRPYFSGKGFKYTSIDLFQDSDVKCDIGRLPFRDETFDNIICYHVLEHIKDDLGAIKELLRVLKDTGTAYIQVPYSRARNETIEYDIPDALCHDHVRDYGAEVVERIRSQGFYLVEKFYAEMYKEAAAKYVFEKSSGVTFICTKGRGSN